MGNFSLFFAAERKQSLGYNWHPECLRCEECGKRLNPGQHAEVNFPSIFCRTEGVRAQGIAGRGVIPHDKAVRFCNKT